MGANLANEVADENFCETTIGCKDMKVAPILRDMMQASYFRVVVVDDEDAVEVCGALKVYFLARVIHFIITTFNITTFRRTSLLVELVSLMGLAWATTQRRPSFVWVSWK